MAKSLLYQDGHRPHTLPPGCGLRDRQEAVVTIRKNGRLYRFVARDKITIDDIYVVSVKAVAFAIQQGEPYAGMSVPRSVKDFLLKLDIVV